jgi:WD40 repeat protein
VVIKCVSENWKSGKIRARVISAGHSESWNVQFPRDIRTSGKCFVVDYNDRGCYTSRGNIREETAQDRLAAIAKNRVRVWSVSEGTCQALCGHSGWVRSVAFSPDGKFIASCSDDKTVRMWSASKGTCLNIFTGHR